MHISGNLAKYDVEQTLVLLLLWHLSLSQCVGSVLWLSIARAEVQVAMAARMRSLGLVFVLLPFIPLGFSSQSCSATPECAVLNLVGDCCPNSIGKYLDCCTPSRQCSGNQKCAVLGLGGLCCPNDAGHQLDCCSAADATALPSPSAVPTVPPVPAATPAGSIHSEMGSENENYEQPAQTVLTAGRVEGELDATEETTKREMKGSRFGPLPMIGFLLLLICIPGLCCWFCWIKVLNKGSSDKARALPDTYDMESVSAVSTRTETTSHLESSACQVGSDELYLPRDLKDSDMRDVPMTVGCCPHVCGDAKEAPPFRTDRRQVNSRLAL